MRLWPFRLRYGLRGRRLLRDPELERDLIQGFFVSIYVCELPLIISGVVNFYVVELVGTLDIPRRASMHATIATFL